MKIASISTGFADIPGQVSLNIFVQGCKLRCKGCQNPDLLDFSGGEEISVDEMAFLLKSKPMTEWICWLGGDAVYQPEDFKSFNKLFQKKNLKVGLYTGKYFEDIQDLIENVDLVIDGPWEEVQGPVNGETTNQKTWYKEDECWKQVNFNELEQIL